MPKLWTRIDDEGMLIVEDADSNEVDVNGWYEVKVRKWSPNFKQTEMQGRWVRFPDCILLEDERDAVIAQLTLR